MKIKAGLIFCVIVTALLSAAAPSYGQFALGVRVGYNASKLSTNIDTIRTDFNSGFHVSVWAHIGKRLYFAPEFGYKLSGGVWTDEGSVNTSHWKQKITVGSLDIPALIGFKIIHSDALTWRVELGPMVSFAVNKKIKDMDSVLGPVEKDNINDVNWYAMAGTGIDFLFMNFDIRYEYGLNPLIKQVQQGNQTINVNTKNGLFLVSVGFKIFGKK
jgi:hypothetical protein